MAATPPQAIAAGMGWRWGPTGNMPLASMRLLNASTAGTVRATALPDLGFLADNLHGATDPRAGVSRTRGEPDCMSGPLSPKPSKRTRGAICHLTTLPALAIAALSSLSGADVADTNRRHLPELVGFDAPENFPPTAVRTVFIKVFSLYP